MKNKTDKKDKKTKMEIFNHRKKAVNISGKENVIGGKSVDFPVEWKEKLRI